MRKREFAVGALLAILGLVVAGALGVAINAISGDSIGLAARPLRTGESLAPKQARDAKATPTPDSMRHGKKKRESDDSSRSGGGGSSGSDHGGTSGSSGSGSTPKGSGSSGSGSSGGPGPSSGSSDSGGHGSEDSGGDD